MKEPDIRRSFYSSAITLVLLVIGGSLFAYLGVPAGTMVGAMFFVLIASLCGIKIKTFPPSAFTLIYIALGMQVSSNISSATIEALFTGKLLVPILIVTVITFFSSILVAFVISRIFSWDFSTSFLAAAPSGISVMTALAIEFGLDPLHISTAHLCRLLAVKTIIPFVFMFLI